MNIERLVRNDKGLQPNTIRSKSVFQRKCGCGNRTAAGGECSKCIKKKQADQQMKQEVRKPQFFAELKQGSNANLLDVPLLEPLPITRGLGAKSRGPLEVSKPSDPSELEANRVAKQLFPLTGQFSDIGINLSRSPSIGTLMYSPIAQRKSIGNHDLSNTTSSPSTTCRSCSGDSRKLPEGIADRGNPLPAKTRLEMESAFGTDFSDVRIHTNSGAAQVTRSLNATAFTFGNEIFFNQGKYDPESVKGKQLLAHELTHTIQQRNAIAMLAREGERKTLFECVNQNLSSAGVAGWLLAIVGTTCGLIGALAGSPTGPGAAGTAAAGAAICIAGVIGYSVGTVLGIIGGCWSDTNFRSRIAA